MTTYSKFLVHNPILTLRLSRYSINSFKPGWGSCSIMAEVSIARIAVWAWLWAGSGSEWMWSRMSVVLGMERAALEMKGRFRLVGLWHCGQSTGQLAYRI